MPPPILPARNAGVAGLARALPAGENAVLGQTRIVLNYVLLALLCSAFG